MSEKRLAAIIWLIFAEVFFVGYALHHHEKGGIAAGLFLAVGAFVFLYFDLCERIKKGKR